jgi:large subunit ribosomal protein L10
MWDLRRRLRKAGSEYKVVKMTLARRATDELGLSELSARLTGPTGLAFAYGDVVATAKAMRDFSKEYEKLVLTGGMLGRTPLTAEALRTLADTEPREVLLAKAAAVLKAPLFQMAGALSAFTRDSASVFAQLLEKKQAQEA